MLLDTCFFIDLSDEAMARNPGPCHAFILANRHTPKRCSVVTLGELSVGAPVEKVLRLVRGCQPVPLGAQTALMGGRLQACLPFEMGENDLWIAATALRHGWPVVTRDKVFTRVPGLRTIKY